MKEEYLKDFDLMAAMAKNSSLKIHQRRKPFTEEQKKQEAEEKERRRKEEAARVRNRPVRYESALFRKNSRIRQMLLHSSRLSRKVIRSRQQNSDVKE